MKANQNFRNADEAVSPVIGVILMVAITVVLAAVVFVLVSDLGGDSESAPSMSFQKDSAANTLTVIKITNGPVSWNDLAVSGCTFSYSTSTNVGAGQTLTCTDGAPVTIVHTPTDSLIYSTTF